MNAVTACVRVSPVMYALFSVLNNFAVVAGCAIMAAALFRARPRKRPALYAFAAVVAAAAGLARPALLNAGEGSRLLGTAILLALPFVCSALLFPRPHLGKALLASFGYTLVEAVKYVILIVVFRYDGENPDDPTEMGVEVFVNAAFFLATLAFLTFVAGKRERPFAVARVSPVFFVLVCLTVGVFIASVTLFSGVPGAGRPVEFAFVLLNIPLLAATVAFSVSQLAKEKAREENDHVRLELQVRHYEMMRQIQEEMRIFRHDFPKKLRPLSAYLENGQIGEARALVGQLDGAVQDTGERFHTGNVPLDTVLFCEDRIARRDGNRVVFRFGGVFPAEGVAAEDVYTIFPNALDNAIEACRALGETCEIAVDSKIVGDTVYVTVRNPVVGRVRVKNGLPVTAKADKSSHGYGLRSIRRAAAKYGEDNVQFLQRGGEFELRISLKFAQQA